VALQDAPAREAAATSATARGLVVLCAANNLDAVKVADHHMAERLARHVDVLFVDPPLSPLTPRNDPALAPSLEGPRLRRVPQGFWRLTPVVTPFPGRPGVRAMSERLVRRAIRRAVAALGTDVRAVVSAWPEFDVFGACPGALPVWWAQDDFVAGAELMGKAPGRVARWEAARAARARLVVAANPAVADGWRARGHDVELIPYGSDPETFAGVDDVAPAAGIDLPRPVAVLVGQLNERVAPELLEAVADAGISLLLVGPARAGAAAWLPRLTARANVAWAGEQPFDRLAAHLAHADVGLVPYADTAFNRGSFPLKTLEYLSAGLPVVATGLPATRWLRAPADLVAVADTPADFVAAVLAAAGAGDGPHEREARRAFARDHSYDRRARDLLAAIGRRVPTTQETT
jgi:glycosyltransferase involved in cell wall biosynthesis